MPPGGVENRSEQLALLAGLLHERGTDPRLGELLAAVEGSDLLADPAAPAAVNVRALRREYDRFVRLPRTLVEDVARTTALAQKAWAAARRRGRLRALPPLARADRRAQAGRGRVRGVCATSRTTRCSRTTSRASGARSSPGCSRRSGRSWSRWPSGSPARRAGPTRRCCAAHFPRDRQRRFGEAVAAAVGFDFGRGRLDPGGPPVLHRHRPRRLPHHAAVRRPRLRRRPVHHPPRGRPRPLRAGPRPRALRHADGRGGVGRDGRVAGPLLGEPGRADRRFWDHFYPRARELFPESLGDVPLDEFHFAVNRVVPSLIRVQADEVTYNLHIMIRFELERALVSGELAVADLPGAWSAAYRDVPRRHAAHRRRGLPPGRPLGGRADRLLPDLHAGRRVRRAALRRGRAGAGQPGRAVRPRRVRGAGAVAGPAGLPAGRAPSLGAADRGRHRLAAGPSAAGAAAAAEVRGAVRYLRPWPRLLPVIPSEARDLLPGSISAE